MHDAYAHYVQSERISPSIFGLLLVSAASVGPIDKTSTGAKVVQLMKTKGQWWAFGPFWQYITRAGGDNYGEQLDKHSDHDANHEENYGKNNHGNKYDINDGNDDHPWDDLAFFDFSWWMTKELPVPHHHHLFRNKEEPTNKQSTKTKEITEELPALPHEE